MAVVWLGMVCEMCGFSICRRFQVDQFDYGTVCSRMATLCAGMSGREISKLGVAWQAAVYASENGLLTETMVLDRCEAAVQQHKQKVSETTNGSCIWMR